MSVTFTCPACRVTISGADVLIGRKVRCPECDEMVVVPEDSSAGTADQEDGAGTVYLDPAEIEDPRGTVMLESIHLIEPEPAVVGPDDLVAPAAVLQPIQVPPPPAPVAEEPERPPMEPNRKLEDTEMDMTPMVDVTFLLLIFFMVTASFTLQKSMEIPLSQSDQASTETKEEEEEPDPNDIVTVMVDENNTYQVTTEDWIEEAPSEQDLYIQLKLAREGDSTGTIPTTLRVEANGEAMYEKVVTALDAGPKTGFSDVLLLTVETE